MWFPSIVVVVVGGLYRLGTESGRYERIRTFVGETDPALHLPPY